MARITANIRCGVGRQLPLIQVGLFVSPPRSVGRLSRLGRLEVAGRAAVLLGENRLSNLRLAADQVRGRAAMAPRCARTVPDRGRGRAVVVPNRRTFGHGLARWSRERQERRRCRSPTSGGVHSAWPLGQDLNAGGREKRAKPEGGVTPHLPAEGQVS